MATVIGKSAKKQFAAYVGEFWTMSQRLLEIIYLHSMATVIGKSAKKQFAAYVGEFWTVSQRLLEIYSWIYENMIDENYGSLTKTGPNKGN